MSTPVPFSIETPQSDLDDIKARVERFAWDRMPNAGGWSAGTSIDYMRELSRYWLESYDWRAAEARLNALPQFRTTIDGVPMHFIHIRGAGASPQPLVLCHGWPGSCFEFAKVAERLAHPDRFGGSVEDSFDVVIPSLPGFGFAGMPTHPIGTRGAARIFHKLMTDVLGYPRYIAQGGDWGAHVAGWLGHDQPASCQGVHLNMIAPLNPAIPAPESEEERAWAEKFQATFQAEGAYFQIQATKPQSLSYAMMDSPVGIAAWLVEKFATWSDLPRDELGAPVLSHAYSRDELLTNIMIYLVSGSFATSTWIYRGFLLEQLSRQHSAKRIDVPTGVAAFPDPTFGPPPRSLVERAYYLVHWTDMPRGGHFAAMEQPELFIEDVRAFARIAAARG